MAIGGWVAAASATTNERGTRRSSIRLTAVAARWKVGEGKLIIQVRRRRQLLITTIGTGECIRCREEAWRS